MLTSSTQLQNRSFHVVERTRTSTKCQKMKNARAKRAKLLFFIVKYANLWRSRCRRRRGCLSSPLTNWEMIAETRIYILRWRSRCRRRRLCLSSLMLPLLLRQLITWTSNHSRYGSNSDVSFLASCTSSARPPDFLVLFTFCLSLVYLALRLRNRFFAFSAERWINYAFAIFIARLVFYIHRKSVI